MFRRIASLGFSFLSCFGVLQSADAQPNMKTVTIQQEWIPFSGYAGEVLAATEMSQKLGLRLRILPGGETVDPIKAVLSGRADFGVVGGDLLIAAVQKGVPIVAVGVVNDRSPTCFISRSALKITGPKDFVGKRVGILRGTNTEKIYEILMRRNGVDRKAVTEVDAPFDLPTFIAGEYDVRPGFIYDEPVTLAKSKIDFNILKPSDFNARFIGTVYFTRRSTVRNNRELVMKLVTSLARGWQAVSEPGGIERSISALKKMFPEVDEAREAESLRLGLPFFLGPEGTNMPLDSTEAAWSETIAGLEEIGSIPKGSVKISDVWDSSFVNQLYRKSSQERTGPK